MEAPSRGNWKTMFVFMIYVVVDPNYFKDYPQEISIEFEDLS